MTELEQLHQEVEGIVCHLAYPLSVSLTQDPPTLNVGSGHVQFDPIHKTYMVTRVTLRPGDPGYPDEEDVLDVWEGADRRSAIYEVLNLALRLELDVAVQAHDEAMIHEDIRKQAEAVF